MEEEEVVDWRRLDHQVVALKVGHVLVLGLPPRTGPAPGAPFPGLLAPSPPDPALSPG